MSKRITISEEERIKILELHENFKKVLKEQDENLDHAFVRAIQRFLNEKFKINLKVDGLTDNNQKSETAKAIARYQQSLGVIPTDGVWGDETWSKMPKQDSEKLKAFIADEGGFIDKILHKIGL